jgi:hypothetical protein
MLDNIGTLPFISWGISDFNETFMLLFVHARLQINVPSFAEKYPKIKYAISDNSHNLVMDLCEASI